MTEDRIAMGSFRNSPPPDADKPIILTPSEGGFHVRAAQPRARLGRARPTLDLP